MNIPKINTDVISNIIISDTKKMSDEFKSFQRDKNLLEVNSKKAMIKMAEKNWVEKNPIIYGVLMATIGAIITIILERLL